ncbi:CKLF-like MARVEL transmembrane domain-containing protein 2 isoform X3 [Heterocephalus glaber]|uniref:CKLF-like MARVEL transmembrane domain-containing protein 2 isoform X3 n=1 Tax=Heterocephalus glaber TaxID=10181 RepID=A0AAX6SSD0_HETGA|nr:CKLF-like MARVEL transmembrane domain-containing protein 2 isoform X3 [Heterocephalus glaber]
MADKGQPPPPKPREENKNDKKEGEQLKVQPKDEVGTRKGLRCYRWELKDSNKEFWVLGHGPVKFLSLDLLNDLFVCVFLGGSIYFGVQKQQPDLPVNYLIALILMGIAAFSAFLDICFQRKHFKGKRIKRNILDPPPKAGAPEKPAEEKPPAKEPEKPANKGKPGDKAAADKGKGKDKAPPKGKK